MSDTIIPFIWFCVAAIGVGVFRCVGFGWRTFFILMGGYMSKKMQKKVIDGLTGVELTPGEPTVCLGNGEQGFECCCDECDYFLLCFPQFYPKSNEKNIVGEVSG